jgi:hypothetical protein
VIIKKLGIADVNVLDTTYIFLQDGKPKSTTIKKRGDIFYTVMAGLGIGEQINVGYSADEKLVSNIFKVYELKSAARDKGEAPAAKDEELVGKFMIRDIYSLVDSINEDKFVVNFNEGAVLYDKYYIKRQGNSDSFLKNIIIDKDTAESVYLSECDIVLWRDPLAKALRDPIL